MTPAEKSLIEAALEWCVQLQRRIDIGLYQQKCGPITESLRNAARRVVRERSAPRKRRSPK